MKRATGYATALKVSTNRIALGTSVWSRHRLHLGLGYVNVKIVLWTLDKFENCNSMDVGPEMTNILHPYVVVIGTNILFV